MSKTWDEFKENIKNEYNNTNFVIEKLDHQLNVLLERRQAIMAKDVNPLVVQMDNILDSINPSDFGGDYLYKDDWYKNLDLESWGIYKYISINKKEGFDENTLLVDSLGLNNEIKIGAELLITTDSGEKVPRTVESIEYSDVYEEYLVTLKSQETTWDRKYMPDTLYPKCIDPDDEKACTAKNPCSDDFYNPPIWDEDLPEFVDSTTIPLKIKYGVPPYTWSFISGEDDGWSLEYETTNDEYNTLYSDHTCDIPAILNVTDYCGNSTDEYSVTNIPSLSEFNISGPSSVTPGDDIILNVNGGNSPYTWYIKEQSYNTHCSDNKCETLYTTQTSGTTNIVYTGTFSCGSLIIGVEDKCQNKTDITINFTNTNYIRVYWYNVNDSSVNWNDSSHYEYDDEKFSNWPYKRRPVLIEIRSVMNNYFNSDFLKEPFLYEISEKLYSNSLCPHSKNDDPFLKIYPFPEYGYINGEENEPKEVRNFVDSWYDLEIPGYTGWFDNGYNHVLFYGKWRIDDNTKCCFTYNYIQYGGTSYTCLDDLAVANMYVYEQIEGSTRPRTEPTAALNVYYHGRSAWYTGPGSSYGFFPFYCVNGVYQGNKYGDCGRYIGGLTIHVNTCANDQGVWKRDENGNYTLINAWTQV